MVILLFNSQTKKNIKIFLKKYHVRGRKHLPAMYQSYHPLPMFTKI
jgi:hypothetical protein